MGISELKKTNKDNQKCYIWLNDIDTKDPLAVVNGCYFPVINERIIIWDEVNSFQNYKVIDRIYGINKESESIVLNIYVEKIDNEPYENN